MTTPAPGSQATGARTVTARALAKINLHLAIHARRPDGYHGLTTVFQAIGLHDTVSVVAHEGPFSLQCDEPGVPTDATNLVWRAAAAYAEATGRAPLSGVRVTLAKRVPTQAGLGGGSADAIATLRALARLWHCPLDEPLAVAMGRGLGADVPFFASGGTMLGTGRGDVLSPLPDVPRHAVAIVRPPFGIGTADAYRWVADARTVRREPTAPMPPASWPQEPTGWPEVFGALHNDFEPVVAGHFPEVGEVVSTLRARGAVLAMLSGSGSAVVGLFARDRDAADAAALFAPRAGWRVWVTETVSRQAYAAAVEPLETTETVLPGAGSGPRPGLPEA